MAECEEMREVIDDVVGIEESVQQKDNGEVVSNIDSCDVDYERNNTCEVKVIECELEEAEHVCDKIECC